MRRPTRLGARVSCEGRGYMCPECVRGLGGDAVRSRDGTRYPVNPGAVVCHTHRPGVTLPSEASDGQGESCVWLCGLFFLLFQRRSSNTPRKATPATQCLRDASKPQLAHTMPTGGRKCCPANAEPLGMSCTCGRAQPQRGKQRTPSQGPTQNTEGMHAQRGAAHRRQTTGHRL